MSQPQNAQGENQNQNSQQPPQGQPGQNQQGSGTPPATFEAWSASLQPEHKALIENHTQGLKSALASEREGRAALEKQIKDLAGKAEKGSDLEKQLGEISSKLESETRRAAFYESAHAAGVSNLALAFIAAQQFEAFKRNGDPDWELLKAKAPELFRTQTTPPGNAGAGTGSGSGSGEPTMNERIRAAAGR